MVEMMVPGNKVGLVIGKGGETIRQLQERAGVKMVLIQDGTQQMNVDKPLRITGDPSRCEKAKEMVHDLIMDKALEIMVPRTAVGVVIGKGGDMIRKIQVESGARVQFSQNEDPNGSERTCVITGPPEQKEVAASMINELIQSALNRGTRGPPMGGRGGGGGGWGNRDREDRPRSFGDRRDGGGFGGGMGRGGGGGGSRGGGNRWSDDRQSETTYSVPADKCGLVIGKGGETIREINRQSGAFVQLQRQPTLNPMEKVFSIRGDPAQIQHAIQLVCERAGLPPDGASPSPSGGPGGDSSIGGSRGGGYDSYGSTRSAYDQQSQPAPQQSYTPQGWGSSGGGGGGATYSQWQDADNDTLKSGSGDSASTWGYYGKYYNQSSASQQTQDQMRQQQTQQSYTSPAKVGSGEAGATAWGYYGKYYNQNGASQQTQGQMAPQQAPSQQSYTSSAYNPSTGQPDYSAAWAEYYRQQGMHQHAQAVLAQAQQPGQGGGPQ